MPTLHVQCDSCKKFTLTEDGLRPHNAVTCDCCPEDHDHGAAGTECRPVTITLTGPVKMRTA